MTINICVINKEEISVGADDRKTINNMKTFDNVKKIFTPYENWSMVMTMNGPAKFEGRSFENLSEEFKEKQDKNVLKTVENTTYNFLEFLNQTDMDTTDIDVFVNFNLIKFKNKISHELKNCNEKNFNYFIKNVKKHEILPFLLDKDINFDDIIPDFVVNKSEVEEILLKHFSYFIFINSTEVIITGFDEDTRLPSIISFRLFAKTNNSVEYEFSIFETQIKKGLIFTFADDGEVKILFNGIDPNIEENIYSILDFLLCKNRIDFLNFLIDSQNFDTETIKEFKQLNTKFNKLNNDCIDLLKNEIRIFKEYKVSPIFKLVESLSGLELVDLTIFLIQLGYYKKRYSDDFESVGPNANVALMNFHELEFFNSQNLNR